MSGTDGESSTVTPRLRFPEFRKAEGWEVTSLGQIVVFQSGGTPSKSTPGFWNGSIPWVTAKDMKQLFLDDTEDHITTAAIDDGAKQVPAGTVLMLTRGMTLLKDVPICVLRRPMTFNQDVKALQPKSNLDTHFLPWLLLGSKERLLSMVDVAGHGTGKLNTDELKALVVFIPSPAEQQKIADCLTSLDELIVAQGRQVAALAAHKRGLMQQLFPREGETIPRLRFPEFQDGPEWMKAPIVELFDTMTGGTPDRANANYWNGSIPWVTTSLVDFNIITSAEEFISEAGLQNSSAKMFPKGTVLVALYGQGKTRAKVAILGMEAATNQACAAILPGGDIDPLFTFANLSGRYEEMRALSNAGGQENLSQGLIRELPFCYPADTDEQAAVVACLSALDAQIAAESEKLNALKTHKKGLMQQLFPAEEA